MTLGYLIGAIVVNQIAKITPNHAQKYLVTCLQLGSFANVYGMHSDNRIELNSQRPNLYPAE